MSNGIKYQFAPLGDEYQFEEFIKDLFNERYNTHTFQTYKVKGAGQYGIDVYSSEHKIYVQCKKKDIKRTDKDLKKELKLDLTNSIDLVKLLPFLDSGFTFVLASTAKRYDLQDIAAKLSLKHQQPDAVPQLKDIQYLGWEEIEGWLNELPATKDKYYPPIIPKELNTIPPIDKNEVIGRITDLENIEKLLKSDKPLLIVNGLGGIGKTTMAKYYVQHAYNSYDHIAWITVTEDLSTSLLSDLVLLKQLGLVHQNDEERKKIVDFWVAKLKTIPGKNLLVIDNATKNIEAYSNQLRSLHNWKVLFTSRESLNGLKANSYLLGVLDWEDAMQLFRDYYLQEVVSNNNLKKVLTLIGRHTMTIKLLAKTFEAAGRTFAQMQERLESQGLKFSQIYTDDPDYQIWDAEKKTMVNIEQANIDQWVKSLFTWNEATLSKEEETILMYFSVLPSYNYGIDFLAGLFKKIEETAREILVNTLNNLAYKGWMDKIADEHGIVYNCHVIVQHVVREKTKPNWENCEVLVDSITAMVRVDEVKDNHREKFPYILFADNLLIYLIGDSASKGRLLNSAGILHKYLGNYSKALDYLNDALNAGILIYKEDPQIIAIRRSNLATIYQDLGNLDRAKETMEQVLNDYRLILGSDHPQIAVCLSNLGVIYKDLEDFGKAQKLLNTAFELSLKFWGEDHQIVNTVRGNLALAYQGLGKHEMAKELMETALQLGIVHFGEEHPSVSRIRSNLALTYRDLGDFDRAKEELEIAVKNCSRDYGEDHPVVATILSNLALVYSSVGDNEKAKNITISVLNSAIKKFGKNHPSVAARYNNLGILQIEIGATEEGVANLITSYEICLECLGVEHPKTKYMADIVRYYKGNTPI